MIREFLCRLTGPALVALIMVTPTAARSQEPPRLDAEWVGKWTEDLAFAKQRFPEAHADLYNTLSREDFESSIDALTARLPELSHVEATIELARIVVALGDGHTRVTLPLAENVGFRQGHTGTPTPEAPGLAFRQYPIRLFTFPDGLRITSIDSPHGKWAGARVTHIGSMSVEDAMAAVAEVVHRDNEPGIQRWLPRYMSLAEVLYGVGVVESPEHAAWTVANAKGEEETLTLTPVVPGAEVAWVHARDESRAASPLWLEDPENFFWYEYLPDTRTVYFQYNRVDNKEDEDIDEFASGMFEFIESNDVGRLVIDLRHNDGGDNSLNRSLIHRLIRSSKLRERGSLYAIIGRETFSAALMFVTSLEKHTPVLFVGEPTGASPNDYGDSRKVQLPNSGLTVRLSTLYWQTSGPTDTREAVEPHIPVALTIDDWIANRDPVLERILAIRETDVRPEGTWSGAFSASPWNVFPVKVTFTQNDDVWTAVLDVEGTELQNVPMDDVSVNGSRVAFDWMFRGAPIRFRGRLVDGGDGRLRLLADARRSGRLSLMLLESPQR